VFQEVEFEDGTWADYDEDNDCPVSINDLESALEVA
jgi:hypothetical protein